VLAGAVATVPLLLFLRWSLGASWGPVARVVALMRGRIAPIFAGCSPVQLALISLFAGLGEEALFRGVLQAGLETRFSLGPALVAASAAFGVVHLLTPAYAALAGLVGCYLGILFAVFDNLLVPLVAHALYDFVALSVLVRLRS
jgi:membrane protease YdiL (CAAX protease family)